MYLTFQTTRGRGRGGSKGIMRGAVRGRGVIRGNSRGRGTIRGRKQLVYNNSGKTLSILTAKNRTQQAAKLLREKEVALQNLQQAKQNMQSINQALQKTSREAVVNQRRGIPNAVSVYFF